MATSSISSRFSSDSRSGGPDSSGDSSAGDFPVDGRVSGLTVPSLALGFKFSSRVPGGCMGSYSSVASVPASWRIILEPPGWWGIKSVTS